MDHTELIKQGSSLCILIDSESVLNGWADSPPACGNSDGLIRDRFVTLSVLINGRLLAWKQPSVTRRLIYDCHGEAMMGTGRSEFGRKWSYDARDPCRQSVWCQVLWQDGWSRMRWQHNVLMKTKKGCEMGSHRTVFGMGRLRNTVTDGWNLKCDSWSTGEQRCCKDCAWIFVEYNNYTLFG